MFSGLCCKPAILGLFKQRGSLKNRFEFSPGRADPYSAINPKDSELCILSKTVQECLGSGERNPVNEVREKHTARRTLWCSVLSFPCCLTLSITPEKTVGAASCTHVQASKQTVLRQLLRQVMQGEDTSLLKSLCYFILREGSFTLT